MEADAYADSSFIVSLHLTDAHHDNAHAFMARMKITLAFTPLHRLEVRNAMRNAVAFGQMAAADCQLALRQMDDDLKQRLLIHTPIAWPSVLQRCERLSEMYSPEHPQRAIDLVHIGIAQDCEAKTFISYDARQRRLASAVGFIVKP